ncbi:MAG: histidine-type phosphatase [Prevotella sp.]|nr:histidine-type phosphatase [Prevotella sp.]
MRQLIITITFLCVSAGLYAQTAQEEILKDIHNSASNHLAYPGPKQSQLTPAPDGKTPFYISHYGRHGSRFLIEKKAYTVPYHTLAKADSLGKLTPLGQDVLRRVGILSDEADSRWGELTPLGAKQHREIAKRMYERFPEVFAGNVYLDAKSTVVIRCILSMENALMQLMMLNPSLHVRHDASYHDMYYMNLHDKKLNDQKMDTVIKARLESYAKKYDHSQSLMEKLFNDMDYVREQVDARQLARGLFDLASNVQNTESRKKLTLYDLFSDEEVYDYWKVSNIAWYINYGFYTPNGATQPFSQRNLLRRIIEEADSCLQLEHPGATLRYGHETMVLPLTCLLELNGYGLQTDNIESLERKGWVNFRIFPMAANIQFIFYRSDPQDKDVLVKVLLNENEVTLPVKTKEEPYYKWSDVRDYYLKKLDAYQD